MHDFITGQASFLAKKKSSLLEGEVVVLGAFAESVVIQEALQEFRSIRFYITAVIMILLLLFTQPLIAYKVTDILFKW